MSTSTAAIVRYLGDEPLTLMLATEEVYHFEPGADARSVLAEDLDLFRDLPQFEVDEGSVEPWATTS